MVKHPGMVCHEDAKKTLLMSIALLTGLYRVSYHVDSRKRDCPTT